jgi:hypothetical protein
MVKLKLGQKTLAEFSANDMDILVYDMQLQLKEQDWSLVCGQVENKTKKTSKGH